MPKYTQQSFSKGVLNNNLISRQNLEGYKEACRQADNFLIGRLGELYRRGGSYLVSAENWDRVFPFYSENKTFLIAFKAGRISSSDDDEKVTASRIKVFDMTNFSLDKESPDEDFSDIEASSESVKIFGTDVKEELDIYDSYQLDARDGLSESEIKAMSYSQLGDLMIFANPTFAPFVIRRERGEFVLYRSFVELVSLGDLSEVILSKKSVFSLPYSFYGFGLENIAISTTRKSDVLYFEANLVPRENFDASVLNDRNINDWKNRAFLLSAQRNQDLGNIPSDEQAAREYFRDNVKVFGGVITRVERTSRRGQIFRDGKIGYIIKGEISASNRRDFEGLNDSSSLLFLCDWSERLGFPAEVSTYENRICFTGSKAFPTKLWFSAIPGFRRVQLGVQRITSGDTSVQTPFSIDKPVYDFIFRDQLTFFDKEAEALGLALQDVSSPGSLFINDDVGFSIRWIIGGEVLFIGTSQGVFISNGTNASASSVTPFNEGFIKVSETPVKNVRPILIDRMLVFVDEDNTVKALNYDGGKGYKTQSIDEFFKGFDPSISSTSIKQIQSTLKNFISGKDLQLFSSGVLIGDSNLALPEPEASKRVRNCDATTCVSEYLLNRFKHQGVQDNVGDKILDYSEFRSLSLANFVPLTTSLSGNSTDLPGTALTKYSQDFAMISALLSFKLSRINNITSGETRAKLQFLSRMNKQDALAPSFLAFKNGKNNGTTEEKSLAVDELESLTPLDSSAEPVDTNLEGKIENGFIFEGQDPDSPRLVGVAVGQTTDFRKEFTPSANTFQNLLDTHLYFTFDRKLLAQGDRRISKINYTLLGKKFSTEIPSEGVENDSSLIHNPARIEPVLTEASEASSIAATALNFGSGISAATLRNYFTHVVSLPASVRYSFTREGLAEIQPTSTYLTKTDSLDTFIPTERLEIELEFLDQNDQLVKIVKTELVSEGSRSSRVPVYEQRGVNRNLRGTFIFVANTFVMRDSNVNPGLSGQYQSKYADLVIGQDSNVAQPLTETGIAAYQTAKILELGLANSVWNAEFRGIADRAELANLPPSGTADEQATENEMVERDFRLPPVTMAYDWVQRALFLFKNDKTYLAYCFNPEAGVTGWVTGKMNMFAPVYLKNLEYDLPSRKPALFGTDSKGRILKMTSGLSRARTKFIYDLPNCLDSMVILDTKNSNTLDLTEVKSYLDSAGFEDDDIITIATKTRILRDAVTVDSLGGSVDLEDEDEVIVGLPFVSEFTSLPPAMEERRQGQVFGRNYKIGQTVFNAFFDSEIQINGGLKPKQEPDALYQYEKYGNFAYQFAVGSSSSYDSKLEIRAISPRPFAIGSYTMEIEVGDK